MGSVLMHPQLMKSRCKIPMRSESGCSLVWNHSLIGWSEREGGNIETLAVFFWHIDGKWVPFPMFLTRSWLCDVVEVERGACWREFCVMIAYFCVYNWIKHYCTASSKRSWCNPMPCRCFFPECGASQFVASSFLLVLKSTGFGWRIRPRFFELTHITRKSSWIIHNDSWILSGLVD